MNNSVNTQEWSTQQSVILVLLLKARLFLATPVAWLWSFFTLFQGHTFCTLYLLHTQCSASPPQVNIGTFSLMQSNGDVDGTEETEHWTGTTYLPLIVDECRRKRCLSWQAVTHICEIQSDDLETNVSCPSLLLSNSLLCCSSLQVGHPSIILFMHPQHPLL